MEDLKEHWAKVLDEVNADDDIKNLSVADVERTLLQIRLLQQQIDAAKTKRDLAVQFYQQFIDNYPDSPRRAEAQNKLFELQDKLIVKELLSAQLYYNLGGYFGNINSNEESNYEACIITAQNALKLYPYSRYREDFSLLVMKSKFELAENSAELRRLERYRDAEDECYGFINEYPDSENKALAERYIAKCKKVIKD